MILSVHESLKEDHEKIPNPIFNFFAYVSVSFCSLFLSVLFFSHNKRRYHFNFFLQWTSCIADTEAQTVFSLKSLGTETLNFSCLTVSWGTILILPNGSSSSQTLGLGIHYGLLEVWGACGLTFKYCLLFSVYSTKFCLNNHFLSVHHDFTLQIFMLLLNFLFIVSFTLDSLSVSQSVRCNEQRVYVIHLLKLQTPWAPCRN